MTQVLQGHLTQTPDGKTVRRSSDGKLSVFDLLEAAGAKNPRDLFKRLSSAYPDTVANCDSVKLQRQDGKRANLPTPVCDEAGWRRILTVLPGVMGTQYREAANQLIDLFLKADVSVALSVVDRNNNDADLKRIEARAKGKRSRNFFTSKVAEHGGEGKVYPIISDVTNKGVTGQTAQQLKLSRHVAQTRDGLTEQELVRISYIEMMSGGRLDTINAQGNAEIVESHREVVDLEGAMYRHLTLGRPA